MEYDALMREFEEETDEWFEMMENIMILRYKRRAIDATLERRRRCTALVSGHEMIHEVLNGHPFRCLQGYRMAPDLFNMLRDVMCEERLLKDSKFLTSTEQLAICVGILAHGIANSQVARHFNHSQEIISKHFNSVIRSLYKLRKKYIKLPTTNVNVHSHIKHNRNFYPAFKNALGAIDGTHIPAKVSSQVRERFRNRKGTISQNVMAAVCFDGIFQFVLAGWEGSAADMRILRSAIETGGFKVPEGKYYLVDSGYANLTSFMAPYRQLPYHISNTTAHRNRSRENLYNHRHAQLRNVVERTFGVLKNRFKCLTKLSGYPFKVQVKMVVACCVLHNFLKIECGVQDDADDIESACSDEDINDADEIRDELGWPARQRDKIAAELWRRR